MLNNICTLKSIMTYVSLKKNIKKYIQTFYSYLMTEVQNFMNIL